MHFVRYLTAVTASAAIALGGASPALASPEDGQGCAGIRNTTAYVCLVALNPSNAIPGVSQTGTAVYTSPEVCYLLDCRSVTLEIPTYATTLPSDPVAVVYFNGQYHSIGYAIPPAPTVPPTGPYLQTALDLASWAAELAVELVPNGDVVHWLDCTVESETNDAVDLSSSSSFSGYDAISCTRFLDED